MYSQAQTIILDDVISAVDAETSQHIIKHCFKSNLVSGRTIVIASHAVEALAPVAHKAIFLEDNQVVWQGRGQDLLSTTYMAHLGTSTDTASGSGEVPIAEVIKVENSGSAGTFVLQHGTIRTPRQLVLDEVQGQGGVQIEHWKNVIKDSGGWMFWTASVLILCFASLTPIVQRAVLQ
jgi:energy-coupling factor transporter ATP-binding protein EcfA2